MRRRQSSIASSQNSQKARRRVWAVIAVVCVAGLVVGALFIISATRQNAPPALAKNPADVLLTVADLPQGTVLVYESTEIYAEVPNSLCADRQFLVPSAQGQLLVCSAAVRYPSEDDAIRAYNLGLESYENCLEKYTTTVGDNAYWIVSKGFSDTGWWGTAIFGRGKWAVVGVCRKQAFVVIFGAGAENSQAASVFGSLPPESFAAYLQIMADRVGGENQPHILPPPTPTENKDPCDVVLRQGDLPLYFVENLAERVESQSSSYRTFRTGDAWVTAFVKKFSSEEDAHLFFDDNCGTWYSENLRLVEVASPALGDESVLLRVEIWGWPVAQSWQAHTQEYRFRKGDFVVTMTSNATIEAFDMVPYAAIMDSRI